LPSKREFERKIGEIYVEAKERLERRKSHTSGEVMRQLEYFFEQNDDDL
jgi:hypothetical protein